MTLDLELMKQLAYATGVGVLIGLERSLGQKPGGGREPAPDGAPVAGSAAGAEPAAEGGPLPAEFLGVRTFAVLALLGFVLALGAEHLPFLAPLGLLGVAALIVSMYWRNLAAGQGITTEAAAIGVCALGMLCRHAPEAAGVIGVVLAVLLSAKRFTQQAVGSMRRVELTDTLKFLVILLIVLPLLPNRALDPYEAFNPYKVGFLVVLISGIGYVGYFLTRIFGAERGLGLTGILGGLTSSTAVTAAMALQAKEHDELRSICGFATVLANATMFGRVLVVVAVLDRTLVQRLAWSVGGMAVTATLAAGLLWFLARRQARQGDASRDARVPLKNPFSLGPALKFAAFFVLILFVAKLAKLYYGERGLFAAAGLSGLADVDAITLSLAEQTRSSQLAHKVGAIGITIAVVSNSLVKSGIALYSGGWRFGRQVAASLLLATGVGLSLAFLV